MKLVDLGEFRASLGRIRGLDEEDSKGSCKTASHRLFKDKAKNHLVPLMPHFLRSKSIRCLGSGELISMSHRSPASSLKQGGSYGSFSTDICRLLQLCEDEDDATSLLAVPRPEPNDQTMQTDAKVIFQKSQHQHDFLLLDECKHSILGVPSIEAYNSYGRPTFESECHQFDLNGDFNRSCYAALNATDFRGEDAVPHIPTYLPSLCPPLSAFLGPKCSLWDCSRPAQGLDLCQDFCSNFHAALALNKGQRGIAPVLRPGGIGLKDNLLLAALSAKAEGKDVGIPECKGAATAKSPWNVPEFFDLFVLEGETIREWFFFDKSRRAFESGNRKQRSLPDYNGWGWHESRKQVMDELGGLKRSYYKDPQPLNHFEWHLYEYEISKCDSRALYRLELKRVDGKKSSKAKKTSDSVTNLQKRIGRLSPEFPYDSRRSAKAEPKPDAKADIGGIYTASNNAPSPYDYLVENTSETIM